MVIYCEVYTVLYGVYILCFFFFKQKTAYEMLRSLVGSEMCIRDRANEMTPRTRIRSVLGCRKFCAGIDAPMARVRKMAVSYTHLTLPTIYSV